MSTKWNAQIQFPTDSNFVNRITGATYERSKSSGNPMIILKCEVVRPAEVEINGEMVNIAGVKTTSYFTTQKFDGDILDAAGSERALEALTKNFLTPLRIPVEEFDIENPVLDSLKGKLIYSQMESEVEERRKSPTAAQIAAANEKKERPLGDIMLHPVTGKKLINYWPKMRTIFDICEE